jgi:hypothetical protein
MTVNGRVEKVEETARRNPPAYHMNHCPCGQACMCEFLQEDLAEGERYWCPLHGLMDENGHIEKVKDTMGSKVLHRARELLQEKRVDCPLCPGYWGLHKATEGYPCLGAKLENELLRALETPLGVAISEIKIEILLMNADDTLDYTHFVALGDDPIDELSAPDCQYWVIKRADALVEDTPDHFQLVLLRDVLRACDRRIMSSNEDDRKEAIEKVRLAVDVINRWILQRGEDVGEPTFLWEKKALIRALAEKEEENDLPK